MQSIPQIITKSGSIAFDPWLRMMRLQNSAYWTTGTRIELPVTWIGIASSLWSRLSWRWWQSKNWALNQIWKRMKSFWPCPGPFYCEILSFICKNSKFVWVTTICVLFKCSYIISRKLCSETFLTHILSTRLKVCRIINDKSYCVLGWTSRIWLLYNCIKHTSGVCLSNR